MSFVRGFNGSSDYLRLKAGTCSVSSAFSFWLIARTTKNGVEATLLSYQASGGGMVMELFTTTGDKLAIFHNDASERVFSTTLKEADGWCLIGISKGAGESLYRLHKYVFSSKTWTHQNASSKLGAPNSIASGTIGIGHSPVYGLYRAERAQAHGFVNKAMSDAEWEAIPKLGALSELTGHAALNFFGQALVTEAVTDQTGNGATQSARSGTTAVEEEPPIPYEAAPEPTETPHEVVKLEALAEPSSREGHVLHMRAKKSGGTEPVVLFAKLLQGETPLTEVLEVGTLTTALADYEAAIPKADAETITDYSNLFVEFWGYSEAGEEIEVEVVSLELEIPPQKEPIPVEADTASGSATTSMSLHTGSHVLPATSTGKATATLSLKSSVSLSFDPGVGSASTSLGVVSKGEVLCNPSEGSSSSSIVIAVPNQLYPGVAKGSASASLTLHSATQLPTLLATGITSTTMILKVPIPPGFFVCREGEWIEL